MSHAVGSICVRNDTNLQWVVGVQMDIPLGIRNGNAGFIELVVLNRFLFTLKSAYMSREARFIQRFSVKSASGAKKPGMRF